MAGLEQPTSGEVWFRGKNVTGVPVQKRNVAMVYQQFINYPNFTVFENIASPLRVAGMAAGRDRAPRRRGRRAPAPDADAAAAADRALRRPAAAHRASPAPSSRTADLILLDEPLANLDYKLREELRDELPKLFAGRDAHRRLCHHRADRGAALRRQHRDAARGPRHPVRPDRARSTASPVDLTTAQVFSDPPINTAAVDKRGGEILIGDSDQAARRQARRADPRRRLHARHPPAPHHARRRGTAPAPIEGRVLIAELSGSESVVHFDLDGQTWVSQSHGIHPFEVGSHGEALRRCRRRASSSTPTAG